MSAIVFGKARASSGKGSVIWEVLGPWKDFVCTLCVYFSVPVFVSRLVLIASLHVKFVRYVPADSALQPCSSAKVQRYWLSLPFIGMQGSWIAIGSLSDLRFFPLAGAHMLVKWALEGVSQTNKTTCCAEDCVHTILCNGILCKCRSGGIYNALTCRIAWMHASKHKRHVCTKRLSQTLIWKHWHCCNDLFF